MSRARETYIESLTPSEMLEKLQTSAKRRAQCSSNRATIVQSAVPGVSPPKKIGTKITPNDARLLNFYDQGIYREIIAEESVGTHDIENQRRNSVSNESDWA